MSAAPTHDTVSLTPAEDSVERFKELIGNKTRRTSIQKLNLATFVDDGEGEHGDEQKDYSMDPWHECVARIPDLPSLREVSLNFTRRVCNPARDNFYNYCGTENVHLRTQILWRLFTALDHPHLNVSSLSIENLQDYTPHVYEQDTFRNVRAKLKSLHLKIAMEYSDHGPDGDIDIPEKHAFFNHQLNEHWLLPTQNQLMHLSLYGDDFWGIYPHWDARGLHFPHLKSLCLGKWSMAHAWQIEWILSHAATLEELYLDDCPIAYALRFHGEQNAKLEWGNTEVEVQDYDAHVYPSLHWANILPLFASRLKKLKRFGMAHGPWEDRTAFKQRYGLPVRLELGRYCLFDCGTLPTPWIVDQRMHYGTPWIEEEAKELEEEVDRDCCWVVEVEEESDADKKLEYPGNRDEEQRALHEFVAGLKKDE